MSSATALVVHDTASTQEEPVRPTDGCSIPSLPSAPVLESEMRFLDRVGRTLPRLMVVRIYLTPDGERRKVVSFEPWRGL